MTRLTFNLDANFHGNVWLIFDTDDLGNTGPGGSLMNNLMVGITVNPVNDAPTGANHTIIIPENTSYTFTTEDFALTDADDTPANSPLGVRIESLPAAGTLTNGGDPVAVGDLVNIGQLVFTPATDAFGTGYASFTFRVQDDGGTANGGVDLDPLAKTMTIDVIAPPAITLSLDSVDYFNGTATVSGDVTSPDEPVAGLSVTISGALSATVTTDAAGHFTYTGPYWGTGTIDAQTVDSFGQFSNQPQVTLNPGTPPTISGLTIVSVDYENWIIVLSGTVSSPDEPVAGLTVTISGVATGSVVVPDATGNFTCTASLTEISGDIFAQTIDQFGQLSNLAVVTLF